MPFTLIRGTFHVVNYSPDGDSIRFRPDDAGLVHDLDGSAPRFNARGLSEYMVNFGTADGFKQKLEQSREPVLDLRTSNFTHFDSFVEQAEGSLDVRLTREPEELVFDEMPTRPSGAFSLLMGTEPTAPARAASFAMAPIMTVGDLFR